MPKAASRSLNPLVSRTFYMRHQRQSLMIILAVGLMVFSVALPAFLIITSTEAMTPYVFNYSGRVSIVAPGNGYRAVDNGVMAQVRSHPDVARFIPARSLQMAVVIPTLGELPMTIYAVREQDLPALLDLYHLQLGAGQLPQPESNQIVLTAALARNRQLEAGDIIGKPVHERDGMPTEMLVSGVLNSPQSALGDRKAYNLPFVPLWAGFASYEYVSSHERYAAAPEHMLIVPVAGREAALEAWLEEAIASPRVAVTTFSTSYRGHWGGEQSTLAFILVSEVVLAVVAVMALVILNIIFFMQRQDEFGILYATGHSRIRLMMRTLGESVSVVSIAWLAGAVFCTAFLVYQMNVCASAGLMASFVSLTPWLFTLPIPLAVVIASVGTIAWSLSRLDPVEIIETR